MENAETPKNACFCCNICDFKCIKKSEWIRHVNTIKHIHRHNGKKWKTRKRRKTPLVMIVFVRNQFFKYVFPFIL